MRILLTALLWGAHLASVHAQPVADGGPTQVDPAVHKLDVISGRMNAYLNAMPTLQVETRTAWHLDGPNRRVGGSQCQLRVRHPSTFLLRVESEALDEIWLECASDGKMITRSYRTGDVAIYSRHPGGLAQLLDDAMTDSSVKGSGLDLLVRPDLHLYLMASVSQVQDHGEEQHDGRAAHHFSATWVDGSHVDFWIAADREPVLLRLKRTRKVDLGDEQPHALQIDSTLTWKPDPKFGLDQAEINLAPNAIEVQDIQSFLIKGGTDQLLGHLPPPVALKQLDGSAFNLTRHRAAQQVVLFFFATWVVPSTQDMSAVMTLVKEYEQQGVVFYGVNVGETPEAVRAFVDARKVTHPVILDPKQEAARAFRITSLPVTVLIGKDGTLQAVHVGTAAAERELIQQDLQTLVDGKQLVEAKD